MGSNVVLCATCVDVTDRKLRLFVQAKCQVCLFVCVCVSLPVYIYMYLDTHTSSFDSEHACIKLICKVSITQLAWYLQGQQIIK